MNKESILPKVKKTKKVRKKNINKKELWSKFDNEFNSKELECVYTNSEDKDKCEICSSSLLVTDEGFLCCGNNKCGILYKDILNHNPEWRYYGINDNNLQDPTRCGMPINPLLEQSSYGCKVICQGRTSYEMRKIRRYTEWQSMPYQEKSRYDEFQRISIMATNAGIPKMIIDDALIYHKKISEHKTFRGLNRDGIIAASIYIASRINNYPRTAKEIASMFHLDNTSSTKGCKNAVQIINSLEEENHNSDKTQFGSTKPISFIERYCSRLNINEELTKVCKFIAIRIDKNNLIPENTPHSIAAGIIYFITQTCGLNISKTDIYHISDISEVTINKCFKKLYAKKEELIPKVILEKYSTK